MHRMTKKPGKKKKREHIWAPVLISTSNSELIRVWVWIMKSCFLFGSKYGKSKWWGLRKVSNITAKKRFGSGAHTMRFTLFLTHSETSTIIVPHIYKLLLLWALILMTVSVVKTVWTPSGLWPKPHDTVHCSLSLIISLKLKPAQHVAVAIYWMYQFISLHMQLQQKIIYASHKLPQKIIYASHN